MNRTHRRSAGLVAIADQIVVTSSQAAHMG
jgi:hypothetical protein